MSRQQDTANSRYLANSRQELLVTNLGMCFTCGVPNQSHTRRTNLPPSSRHARFRQAAAAPRTTDEGARRTEGAPIRQNGIKDKRRAPPGGNLDGNERRSPCTTAVFPVARPRVDLLWILDHICAL